MMIMTITFLRYILSVDLADGTYIKENPKFLLYVAGGIALIALSQKWSHYSSHSATPDELKDQQRRAENKDH